MKQRTAVLTSLSLLAFASNSLLCRLALAGAEIDAASFTAVRMISGAAVLGALAFTRLRGRRWPGSAASALALFLYAAPFSYAYLRLGAGVGALILFGAVQVTMIGVGMVRGERTSKTTFAGLALALFGLVGLTVRGNAAPDALGVALMAVAGVAWGVYSLRGRSSTAGPLATTAANFIVSLPLSLLLLALGDRLGTPHASSKGLTLAVISGALASGLGYSLWYAALPSLSATRAAVLQLLVPVIAALGAVLLLGEVLSLRLIVAGGAILAGVALAIRGRH